MQRGGSATDWTMFMSYRPEMPRITTTVATSSDDNLMRINDACWNDFIDR